MNELIQKIEARIAERREELEGWINTSRMVCEAIETSGMFSAILGCLLREGGASD
jgi:hypothetical protein